MLAWTLELSSRNVEIKDVFHQNPEAKAPILPPPKKKINKKTKSTLLSGFGFRVQVLGV